MSSAADYPYQNTSSQQHQSSQRPHSSLARPRDAAFQSKSGGAGSQQASTRSLQNGRPASASRHLAASQQQQAQELLALQKKLAFLEDENKQLAAQKQNLQDTLQINKEILNGVLSGALTNEEDILGQLQEESDMLIGEIQRMQAERDDLSSKVLVLEQINFEINKKQLEQGEAMDKTIADLQEQVNLLNYVADHRDKFLDDAITTFKKVTRRLPNAVLQKCAREVQHIEEIQDQRKQLKQNVISRQQMHLKSVIFERDNLQMELDDALNQIEKLEEQVQVAVRAGGDEVLHTVMEIRANPYEDLEGAAPAKGKDNTVEMHESPFRDDAVDLAGSLGRRQAPLAQPSVLNKPPVAPSALSGGQPFEQCNMKMNLGLHNKKVGNARSKKNIQNMGIPALDLSTLKNVKDFKDWYGYSQKLENAIRLLREKNTALENERDMQDLHI